ncbi:MalY/PatB family protein [Roseibacillus ishigakijimensis]|uniref:cysteine-S-conjugate beta-lyase n=1 Tax=Roseibacillus ishigakijimensis TaxID=454146 RepID=A0A934RP73_9BACT|nr:PatB family C-S lyase [Roseibacillus ishigakijimensis]MBK1832584.1 PatB family C-S lyase [Roseibacillus ishigakijimensis]
MLTPVANRRDTGSLKWDRRPDLDPFWVADMDFQSPPEVMEALRQRVDHGVFGYALPHPSLVETVQSYLARRIGYEAKEEEIVHLGGLVPALSMAGRAFAKPGESLMTCTPVYPPFLGVHRDGGTELITVEHVQVEGVWTFDWEKMVAAVKQDTRVFILSNPQNPLGRVLTEREMVKLATFCQKLGILLVSDEIHCDLILDEEETPHFSALNLPEDLRKNTITLLSPSKTYNIAGLGYAYAVIPDDSVRRRFQAAKGHTLSEINALSYHAAEAAYNHGEPWRQELLSVLRKNRNLLTSTLANELPAVVVPEIEATYLAWIDCQALSHQNPAQVAEEKEQLFLSDGAFFGFPKAVRFNYGCPTHRVQEGLTKLVRALRD